MSQASPDGRAFGLFLCKAWYAVNTMGKGIVESCAVHCYQDMDYNQFIMLLAKIGFTQDISYSGVFSATRQVEYYVYEKPCQKVAIEIEKDTFIDLWYVRFTAEEYKPEMVVNYGQLSYGCGVDELSKNGTERAYTTIKTVMDRLVTKSILVRYKVGKKFFYKVTMDKREMALDMLKEFTDDFFNGNYAEMMHFVEREMSEMLVK